LVVSPAFGFAGLGFPILGMNAFASAWAAILPLRWYMAVLFGQAARGLPLSDSASPFAALAALATVYSLLAFLRLRCLARRSQSLPAARPLPEIVPQRGIGSAFLAEWQRVLGIRGAFIVLIGSPLLYGIYYPQPYLNQILRKLPIAVIDNDHTETRDGTRERLWDGEETGYPGYKRLRAAWSQARCPNPRGSG
jgi:ABC-2 type transport system permease protein